MTMKVLTCAILFLLFCQSSLGTTLRTASTTTKTTVASVHVPTTVASVHVPTTDIPKEASHIISIIVSRKDTATGFLEKVASLSSFDSPIAYTDFGKITVDGHSDSSPIPGELGYLEITWTYPAGYQSGNYTCEIYALDVTLHPVLLSEVVQITASEPTTPELASIILQNNKYIAELSQTVSELKNQTLHLQSQVQENALALNNITEVHRNETKAQNIQTGPVYCYNSHYVTFDRPYNSKPTVLIALSGIAVESYSGNVNITVDNLSETGFTPVCSYRYYTPTAYWIAIDN